MIIFAIAKREIVRLLRSPLVYVIGAGIALIGGFIFFSLILQFNGVLEQAAIIPDTPTSLNHWVIAPYLQTLEIVLLLLVPMLTMRSFAEERQAGSFDLFITAPITAPGLVAGKFLGAIFILTVLVGVGMVFPLALWFCSDPELGPIISGGIGLFLFGGVILSLGFVASALTEHQAIAAGLGSAISLLVYLIGAPAERAAQQGAEKLGDLLTALSPTHHTAQLYRGLLQLSDLTFLGFTILTALLITTLILESERWR